MKKKILYIPLLLTILFVGCDDFLSEAPDTREEIDNLEKVQQILVNAYPEANYKPFCAAMSDNAEDRGPYSDHYFVLSNKESYYWEDPTDIEPDGPIAYWDESYKAISHCNAALEAIDKLIAEGQHPDQFKPYIAEAHVARAYNHFMLASFFCQPYNPATAETDMGIPYMKHVEAEVFVDYDRGTLAEVFENIESDLINYIGELKDEAYQVAKYHMNVAAAYTFASRFYIIKGDWENALKYSNAVLGTGDAANKLRDLNGIYESMSAYAHLAQWNLAEEPANLLLVSNYSLFSYVGQAITRYSFSEELSKWFLRTPSGGSWAYKMFSFGDGMDFVAKDDDYFKSVTLNAEIGWYLVMTRAIVIEEALFNRAEANIMLGNYDAARADFDALLSKRITDYNAEDHLLTEELMEESLERDDTDPQPIFYTIEEGMQKMYMRFLLDQRKREFYFDGLRWFDIRRFQIPVVHRIASGPGTYGDEQIELPTNDLRRTIQIPSFAIDYGMQPNPR